MEEDLVRGVVSVFSLIGDNLDLPNTKVDLLLVILLKYVPHHGVLNLNKPNKVRVIFDAAAIYHETSVCAKP